MNRLACLLLAVSLGLPAARAQNDDEGLDPQGLILPGKRALDTGNTGLLGADFELMSRATSSPLTPQEVTRLRDVISRGLHDANGATRLVAQQTLLSLAERDVLAPQQLVALMDRSFSSPHVDSRETGAVVAGLLIRRSEDEAKVLAQVPQARVRGFSQLLKNSEAMGKVNRGPGVAVHMANAVVMNRERKQTYAAQTEGGSEETSSHLIENEESVLTTWSLGFLDWVASDFVQRGVPVISEDVIPLRPLPTDTPLRYTGRASEAQRERLAERLRTYRGEVSADLSARDFAAVARRSYELVGAIRDLEASWGCHFAMTRHLVATIGYGAWRAHQRRGLTVAECWGPDAWDCMFGVEVTPGDISKAYLDCTLYALPDFALLVDTQAQKVHAAYGVGIIVNEFPGGFFRHVYERDTRKD